MFRQLISHTCIPGQNTCQYFHVHKNTDTYHLHHNTKMFHKAEKSCISNALQIWKSHNTHNNSSLQTQGHSSVKIETLLWVVRGEKNVETEAFWTQCGAAAIVFKHVREQDVPTMEWWAGPSGLTDVCPQPIRAQDRREHDRKYATLPRGGFI